MTDGPGRDPVRRLGAALLGLMVLSCAEKEMPSPAPETATGVVAYENGLWLDGGDFVERAAYVKDGRFVGAPDGVPETRVDLAGGYVVPPFAEAHTHTLVDRLERIDEFLRAGIFYAKVMNATRTGLDAVRSHFNTPQSVDIVAAVGGITGHDAHPLQIGLEWGAEETLDGDWVHLIDTEEDLDEKWPAIAASGTDFVKVFLIYADEYEERRDDPAVKPRHRGMNPALLPEIVARAAAIGLAVSAHVRTAADVRAALAAGVREIAHLPGHALGPSEADELNDPRLLAEVYDRDRFLLTPADAAEAASRGVPFMTTIVGPETVPDDVPPEIAPLAEDILEAGRFIQAENLRTLRKAGVTILIGSDAGELTSVDELLYIDGLDVFDQAELLRMICVDTPRAIFPGRDVGDLAPEGEASFVVLEGNPLTDLSNVRRIRTRVKQGVTLGPIE